MAHSHPEVLWAQRSSETDEAKVRVFFRSLIISVVATTTDASNDYQNILYLTINLPDIIESSLKVNLTATGISLEAKAGK